jgi:integrase
MSYLKGMKDSNLSWSYRMLALSAIKHYYCFGQDDDQDVTLNWTKISRGEQTHDNDLRGYSREEIQMLLNVANIKYKAIILILASSGMRREALCNIKLENMEKRKV